MKISGFTFLKNGAMLGYPFLESIKSVLPIVDEFVIALGVCEDDTKEQILALKEPKIRIIESHWCDKMKSSGYVYGQQKMVAQFNCTGDWAFYLEADELVHENDLKNIQMMCKKYLNDSDVEALVFDYLHFYGNQNTYLWSPGWYRREARLIKTSIRSYAPDGLFWLVLEKNKIGRYPKATLINATIYHYGWIRSEEQMYIKSQKVNGYWDKKPEKIDYSEIDSSILKRFEGKHPKAIQNWLPKANDIYQANPKHKLTKKEKKHHWMLKIEKFFGLELSKKHYRLVK